MDIRIGEKDYRLQRSFHANDKSFTILDLSTGREVKLKEGLISELVPGLTEGTFKNTISIEQLKAPTDAELAAQVRNYIANLSITKSKEVNVAKAVSMLTEQRKQLEAQQNPAALKALQAEINSGMEKEERIDRLITELRNLQKEEQNIAGQKETVLSFIDNEAARRMEQLPAILEKYRSFQELMKQEDTLEAQEKELDTKIAIWEKKQQSGANLKEDIAEVSKHQAELSEMEKQELEYQSERDAIAKEAGKSLLLSLVPACVAAFIIMTATGFSIIGKVAAAFLCAAGILGFLTLRGNSNHKLQSLESKKSVLRQQKDRTQSLVAAILNKYGVSRIEGLTMKLEEALRDSYALEHSKEQKKELEKRKSEIEDSRDVMYETIMKYMQYFIPEDELSSVTMQKLQYEIEGRKKGAPTAASS
jgi:hypothetical protein